VSARVPRRTGFTLVEVVVALTILQVCLLGALGLILLATREAGTALLLERAAAEAAEVADSLAHNGVSGSGEFVRGAWRVQWEAVPQDGAIVLAVPANDPLAPPLVELWVP